MRLSATLCLAALFIAGCDSNSLISSFDDIKPKTDWYSGCDISMGSKDDQSSWAASAGQGPTWIEIGFAPATGGSSDQVTLHFKAAEASGSFTTMKIEYQTSAGPNSFQLLKNNWRIEGDDQSTNVAWDRLTIDGFGASDGLVDLAITDGQPGQVTAGSSFNDLAPTARPGGSTGAGPRLAQTVDGGTYRIIALDYRGSTLKFKLSRP